MDLMTIGAGCFWCVEAIFIQVNGVSDIVSGYSGGHHSAPNYEIICTGKSGHAEKRMRRLGATNSRADIQLIFCHKLSIIGLAAALSRRGVSSPICKTL